MSKNVFLISLGCPKNLVDSEVILADLADEGFQPVNRPEKADVIVITTCCFIDAAKQESIDTILEHAQMKNNGCEVIAVCGCLVQRYGKQLVKLLPEVDIFAGLTDMRRLGGLLRRFFDIPEEERKPVLAMREPSSACDPPASRIISTPDHYAYIKIAEGCSHHCTFCIIPTIRGAYRSRPMADIIQEARWLAEKGVKELILVAQDTGEYGSDREEKTFLPQLIKELAGIDGPQWIRALYINPTNITPQLLEVIGEEPKCCQYLDIPIQHVAPGVLRRMGRGWINAREKLATARRMLPDAHIRTSLLVGFPGETEEEFNELLNFVKEFRFENLGVFTYSREEGTPASVMESQVHHLTKKRRWRMIMEAQVDIVEQRNQLRLGETLDVMVDGTDPAEPGNLIGRTFFQAPEIDGIVVIPGGSSSHIGSKVKVKITGSNVYDLIGRIQPFDYNLQISSREHVPDSAFLSGRKPE